MYETALTRKHTDTPTVAIRMPATAGPTARAAFTSTELRLTALRRSSGPTISSTNAWRVGLSKTVQQPSRPASTKTCQTCTRPVAERIPSTSASDPMQACTSDHQAPLVDAVGDHAAVRAEHQDRRHLHGHQQPERGAGVGQRQQQPALGDRLHPGADQRDGLAGVVAAVVRDREGRERARLEAAQDVQRGSSRTEAASASRAGSAASSAAASASDSASRWRARLAVRSAWMRAWRCRPAAGHVDERGAAIVGRGRAGDQPGVAQLARDARQHRRVEALQRGQFGEPDRAGGRDGRQRRELRRRQPGTRRRVPQGAREHADRDAQARHGLRGCDGGCGRVSR